MCIFEVLLGEKDPVQCVLRLNPNTIAHKWKNVPPITSFYFELNCWTLAQSTVYAILFVAAATAATVSAAATTAAATIAAANLWSNNSNYNDNRN